MFPAFTTSEFFQTCRFNGFLAVLSPSGWRVLRGRDRIASGPETGADARALAVKEMR